MPRILIADDHELIRRGLRLLLEARANWQICGEATNGRQAVEKATELLPDVVLLWTSACRSSMAWRLPVLSGARFHKCEFCY